MFGFLPMVWVDIKLIIFGKKARSTGNKYLFKNRLKQQTKFL